MFTTQTARPETSLFANAAARARNFIARIAAPADSELWQLYRMTRGSDSVRPSVIRHLEAHAAA